jgi:general secretion pathway protein N
MIRRQDILFFAFALIAALVLSIPMRVAVGAAGMDEGFFAARDSKGTLWSGQFDDVRLAEIRLGDLGARFSPVPLLLGGAKLHLSGGTSQSRASLFVSRGTFGVADVDARFTSVGLLAPLPLTQFELEEVSFMFGSGRCVGAGGVVRAHASTAAAGLGLPQTFRGAPRCSGERLLIPLASSSGQERIDLRIASSGRFEAALRVNNPGPAVASRLEAAGFRRTARGYATVVRGAF